MWLFLAVPWVCLQSVIMVFPDHTRLLILHVFVIQCFVLVMEYVRGSGAPECIFHNQHKTLYSLFSPDLALSCVCDKLVTHCKINTLCSTLSHLIKGSVISFLAIYAFTWDKCILLTAFLLDFFQNYLEIIDHKGQNFLLVDLRILLL